MRNSMRNIFDSSALKVVKLMSIQEMFYHTRGRKIWNSLELILMIFMSFQIADGNTEMATLMGIQMSTARRDNVLIINNKL